MALDEIRQSRLDKLKKIKDKDINPYPSFSNRTHKIEQVLASFDDLENSEEEVVIAGRVLARREHGGSVFLDINDGANSIQIYLKRDVVGDDRFNFFSETVDIGDFIEVRGTVFKTKKGEETIQILQFGFLTKSLLPLPEKWHGLQDTEDRFRKRYLDILFNDEVRSRFKLRSKIITELRNHFIDNEFMEVDTPILHPLAGGALAKPFKTHMNDLDLDLYLRVAPELYLKRLLVGGYERVFEIGKNFRNEGMDREHNPEFTMLEAYVAYKDYNWLMNFTEELLRSVINKTIGTTVIDSETEPINFGNKFEKIEFNDLLKKYSNIDYDNSSEEDLRAKAEELGIVINKEMTKGIIADEIYKKVARPKIIQPTFVINHPLDISPLAKKIEGNPTHVERFQLLVDGMEVLNAFSELNDPIDQRERFQAQEKNRERGDEEAHRMDEDFIEALEYGMPPAAGIGIGVDRIVKMITKAPSLREVILFPTMKPQK